MVNKQPKPIKDSGERQEYSSGMHRDLQEGKPDFTLLYPADMPFWEQPMTRVALHMTAGITKYGYRNWELANSQEELIRFKSSALRHMLQFLAGEDDEEHFGAVIFNLFAIVYVQWRLRNE